MRFLFILLLTLQANAQDFKGIDSLLRTYIDSGWNRGAVALVARNGTVLYHKAFGANADGTPLRTDALFRIASQTKAITSAGIAMLMEEGKLKLNDPVEKYIPAFRNPKVITSFNGKDTSWTARPAARSVTLHDLLTHTSGLGYAQIGTPEANAMYAKADVIGGIGVKGYRLDEVMDRLGPLPLFHDPGAAWTYGLNTDVLGRVIEVASGLPLDRFFATRIFGPLGMTDTYFYLPEEKRSRLVTLYTLDAAQKVVPAPDSSWLNGPFYAAYPARPGTYFSGGGGLTSTAADYARFMQLLLNEGTFNGRRLLQPATVRLLTTNAIGNLKRWNENRFGLGFELIDERSPGTALPAGAYLWGGMFSSSYWIDPKTGIVAQLFLNQYPNPRGEVHDRFKEGVYRAVRSPRSTVDGPR